MSEQAGKVAQTQNSVAAHDFIWMIAQLYACVVCDIEIVFVQRGCDDQRPQDVRVILLNGIAKRL